MAMTCIVNVVSYSALYLINGFIFVSDVGSAAPFTSCEKTEDSMLPTSDLRGCTWLGILKLDFFVDDEIVQCNRSLIAGTVLHKA
ncbi:hypothetical protein ACH5RR_038416 [Cinchona calisaya]|uniref:Secreted protein n=1 Tax=Cinchona calisaya TaxID=153742 RepID=A0ABD2Y0T6_9GENT